MSSDSILSRLCRLIDDSLRPYTDMQNPEVICSTKGTEKDLLIGLSRVWREIQLMKKELDCDSDEEEDLESDCDEKSSEESELQHEYRNCSNKILAELMILLTVESQFVQHLAGNILVVVAEFVAQSGNEWGSFIPSLFICLKLAMSNVLCYTLATSTNGPEDRKCDSSSLVVLRSRLRNANWSTVGAILRVLRCTLKYLKQEGDDQLHETYINCATPFLLNVPWDVMEENQVDHSSDSKERSSLNGGFTATKFVFLGNFIQFLCSLVEQSCSLESKVGAQDNHSLPCVILSLVPRLLRLFLGKQGNHANLSISLYFRHKLLMLMLRLSYHNRLGYSTLISWLELLHEYYEEILHKPIIQLEISQDEFLEGSPFLASLADGEVKGLASSHLQRWGILLFLRCCFCLLSLTGDIPEQCACVTLGSISDLSCARNTGFVELHKWLQQHLPTDLSVACEMYSENCIGFSSSFLQLYMHEDDVLFKVLLQLLSIQSSLEQLSKGEKWASENVNKDILFQALSMFNPVYLFHLFLAELHYDHQVILDYLISKDTGASCAEYLLRSLRVVCNSWNLFVTFSAYEKLKNPSSCKKRKLLLDGFNVQAEVSSVSSQRTLSPGLEKHEKEVEDSWKHDKSTRQMFKEAKNCDSWKHDKSTRQMFKEAKNCLLSLKCSVENLHRKNLFPYNPEVLLRRLTKFQELCFELNNHCISLTGEPS